MGRTRHTVSVGFNLLNRQRREPPHIPVWIGQRFTQRRQSRLRFGTNPPERYGRAIAGAAHPGKRPPPNRNVYITALLRFFRRAPILGTGAFKPLILRLHERLEDYSYRLAQAAHDTGLPIVRPVFLADPSHPAAWENWWTYEYGPDLLVSPIWEKGKRSQQVYLPAGGQWRDAWHPDKTYPGGQTIEVRAELHQVPLFIRVGANPAIGDLNREWEESVEIARKRPDLKSLESTIKLN